LRRNVAAGAGVKNNSDGIGAGARGGDGILGSADSADFYPGARHAKMVIEKPRTRN